MKFRTVLFVPRSHFSCCLDRNNETAVDATKHFWVSSCLDRGCLVKLDNEFFLCSGRTTGVMHDTELQWKLQNMRSSSLR